jgi:transcriptional regulator GlxA family with amidase domain
VKARRAIFDEAAEIVARDFPRPLRIYEVARRVAASPRQLQRVFADVGGLGFRAHLRRVRLTNAADLLAATDVPVKEVARRVGYTDASQFSKAFRRSYGLTPSQARGKPRSALGQNGGLPRAGELAADSRGYRAPEGGRGWRASKTSIMWKERAGR